MATAKRYAQAVGAVDRSRAYSLEEAAELVKKTSTAKFDETVETAIRLGVNPKHADQMVRGAVVLPHGIGKSVRVLVFAKGDKEKEAREAGADFVGAEDLIEKIQGGWLDFDKAGIIHAPIGKASFSSSQLYENAMALLEAVMKAKPASAKGQYLRGATLSSTMGPGIRLDAVRIANLFRK